MGALNEITRLFVQYVDLKARQYTSEALLETRQILAGVLLMAASGIFWFISMQGLFASFFLRLSPLEGYTLPALYTGLFALAFACLLTFLGVYTMGRRARWVPRQVRQVHGPGNGGVRNAE